jgi:hypothetical protein
MSSEEISDWYALLDARVLDLVGDYAGRELFLLEGDSLVLQCLDDRRLDFHGILFPALPLASLKSIP